jgi:hypothetical protein
MPLQRSSLSLPAVSLSGVWQITDNEPLRNNPYLHDYFVTVPYASHGILMFGCF